MDEGVTLTFEERDGVTTLTQSILHSTKEGRDGHLRSGIDVGLKAMFARLDALIGSFGSIEASTV